MECVGGVAVSTAAGQGRLPPVLAQLQESELAGALQKKPEFVLPQHKELFHFAISISILQNAKLPLCLASLTKLPPNITQLTHLPGPGLLPGAVGQHPARRSGDLRQGG